PQSVVVPAGRVYVRDPDDWDAAAKTYRWKSSRPHPAFTLNTTTGDLTMAPHTHDGSYNLGFLVSDATQGQSGVAANVTVTVEAVARDNIITAIPITPKH
ncbi:hypothetical protein Pmani_030756, partial [Petrolisthes manimaculis]